jgi:ketosteroid isomerase-like protein
VILIVLTQPRKISRRGFLRYAAAGIVAAAVAGGSYYYITQKPAGIPSTISPTSATPSPTGTTSCISPLPSPFPTPTTPTIPSSPMSEDEKMARQLLEKDWVAAFNSENLDRILSLYTEDATLLADPGYYYKGLRGDHSLSWHFTYFFGRHDRVVSSRVVSLNILDNKAEAFSYVDVTWEGQVASEHSQYKLRKITEITKDRITTKLPKPIWRIYDEHESWIY